MAYRCCLDRRKWVNLWSRLRVIYSSRKIKKVSWFKFESLRGRCKLFWLFRSNSLISIPLLYGFVLQTSLDLFNTQLYCFFFLACKKREQRWNGEGMRARVTEQIEGKKDERTDNQRKNKQTTVEWRRFRIRWSRMEEQKWMEYISNSTI